MGYENIAGISESLGMILSRNLSCYLNRCPDVLYSYESVEVGVVGGWNVRVAARHVRDVEVGS